MTWHETRLALLTVFKAMNFLIRFDLDFRFFEASSWQFSFILLCHLNKCCLSVSGKIEVEHVISKKLQLKRKAEVSKTVGQNRVKCMLLADHNFASQSFFGPGIKKKVTLRKCSHKLYIQLFTYLKLSDGQAGVLLLLLSCFCVGFFNRFSSLLNCVVKWKSKSQCRYDPS